MNDWTHVIQQHYKYQRFMHLRVWNLDNMVLSSSFNADLDNFPKCISYIY